MPPKNSCRSITQINFSIFVIFAPQPILPFSTAEINKFNIHLGISHRTVDLLPHSNNVQISFESSLSISKIDLTSTSRRRRSS